MSSQTDTPTNPPILPDDLRRVLNERGSGPLELVDPANQRAYVLLPREQYETLLRALPHQAETRVTATQSA